MGGSIGASGANGQGPEAPLHGLPLWRSVAAEEWARVWRLRELFPWTPLGVTLTLAAYAALEWLAYAQLDLVFLVLGYAGLGLSVLAPLLTIVGAIWLRIAGPSASPDDEPRRLETGVEADSGFVLPSLWFLPLIQVRWRWDRTPGPEVRAEPRRGRLHERARVLDRGRYRGQMRRVVVQDSLGLSRVAVRVRGPVALDVLPRLGGLRHLPSMTALASGDALPHPMGLDDGDRLELVRYTPGDPARFIHWKVLGRTRRLMVRMPERALSVARRTAAFMLAGQDDDASAAVARLALEQRLLGVQWVFGTDADPAGSERVDEAMQLLIGSSASREAGGRGLAAFVERAERSGPVRVVVFAPPRPGPWVERVVSVAAKRSVRVVIGIDALTRAERPPLWRRLLLREPAPTGTPSDALAAVTEALVTGGCEVRVLERGSGRVLGQGHTRALRALERKRVA